MDCFQKLFNKILEDFKNNPLKVVYICVFILCFILFSSSIISTKGLTLSNAFFNDKKDTFMDFFNSVYYSIDLPYGKHHVIYPALVTVSYMLIGKLCSPYLVTSIGSTIGLQFRNSQMSMMLFLIITFIFIYVGHYLVRKIFKPSAINELLCLILFCSFPLVYGIERGNSILYVLVFTLIFVIGYQSDNKYIRYLSYLSLAIATGIKIYVILFSLLLIRDRHFREFIILYSVTIIVFIVPFIFTDGTFYSLLHNIFSYTGGASVTSGSFYSIKEFLGFFNKTLDESTRYYLQYILFGILYISLLLSSFFAQCLKKWQLLVLICCAITLGMGTSATYNNCLFLIPLIFFFNEEDEMSLRNVVYLSLFLLMMIWVPAFNTQMIVYVGYIHTIPPFILEILILVHLLMHRKQVPSNLKTKIVECSPIKTILVLTVSTAIVIVSLVSPLYTESDTVLIENNGNNTVRLVNDDEEIVFSFDSTTNVFTSNCDGSYIWSVATGETLISTDNGYVGVSSGMYIRTGTNSRVGVNFNESDITSDWSGTIKNNTITVNYTKSNGSPTTISWKYNSYATIPSNDGDLSYFSASVNNSRIYLSDSDEIISTMYSNKHTALFGIRGTTLWVNGEQYSDSVRYNFTQPPEYPDIKAIRTNYTSTAIVIPGDTDDHNDYLIGYIVPRSVYSVQSITDREIEITKYVCGGLFGLYLIGLGITCFYLVSPRNKQYIFHE